MFEYRLGQGKYQTQRFHYSWDTVSDTWRIDCIFKNKDAKFWFNWALKVSVSHWPFNSSRSNVSADPALWLSAGSPRLSAETTTGALSLSANTTNSPKSKLPPCFLLLCALNVSSYLFCNYSSWMGMLPSHDFVNDFSNDQIEFPQKRTAWSYTKDT